LRCIELFVGSAAAPTQPTEGKMLAEIALIRALGAFLFGAGVFLQGLAALVDTGEALP
jgi:hypothetical protein